MRVADMVICLFSIGVREVKGLPVLRSIIDAKPLLANTSHVLSNGRMSAARQRSHACWALQCQLFSCSTCLMSRWLASSDALSYPAASSSTCSLLTQEYQCYTAVSLTSKCRWSGAASGMM
jgi:hypothetical protein